jgi:hypothetical protein
VDSRRRASAKADERLGQKLERNSQNVSQQNRGKRQEALVQGKNHACCQVIHIHLENVLASSDLHPPSLLWSLYLMLTTTQDMHYAEFDTEEAAALFTAIKEYEANKWKVIGQKLGKPAKVSLA